MPKNCSDEVMNSFKSFQNSVKQIGRARAREGSPCRGRNVGRGEGRCEWGAGETGALTARSVNLLPLSATRRDKWSAHCRSGRALPAHGVGSEAIASVAPQYFHDPGCSVGKQSAVKRLVAVQSGRERGEKRVGRDRAGPSSARRAAPPARGGYEGRGAGSAAVAWGRKAASGFEPLHGGFADLSLNHLGTPP